MGRIVDLCGEIAAEAEEGPEGLVLSVETWDRLRADWDDEDIDDAMSLVRDSLMQGELIEAADSLSSRLVEILGAFGEPARFQQAEAGQAGLSLDTIGHLARRVDRLEEILEVYREGQGPDRRGFDALRRQLADQGIETEMREGRLVLGDDGDNERNGEADDD
jgi:hypothetical protein